MRVVSLVTFTEVADNPPTVTVVEPVTKLVPVTVIVSPDLPADGETET